ncbi:hypothetical protein DFS33DRAFT_1398172 [Desarmillaria ectypa]|nr:hypothetical protein DFS33DRAFT_1398172 [Desarmillaria ectypa]
MFGVGSTISIHHIEGYIVHKLAWFLDENVRYAKSDVCKMSERWSVVWIGRWASKALEQSLENGIALRHPSTEFDVKGVQLRCEIQYIDGDVGYLDIPQSQFGEGTSGPQDEGRSSASKPDRQYRSEKELSLIPVSAGNINAARSFGSHASKTRKFAWVIGELAIKMLQEYPGRLHKEYGGHEATELFGLYRGMRQLFHHPHSRCCWNKKQAGSRETTGGGAMYQCASSKTLKASQSSGQNIVILESKSNRPRTSDSKRADNGLEMTTMILRHRLQWIIEISSSSAFKDGGQSLKNDSLSFISR